MSPNPTCFLRHLREEGYHPRSNKHSNNLSECIVEDLIENCRAIRDRAAQGKLVYSLNFTLFAGTAEWNVDLVLGKPPAGALPPLLAQNIQRTPPSTVEIAVEIKSVMTEHHKAVKNRKRDFEAHHDHVHRYSNDAIAGGVLVINASSSFRSPLRTDLTQHRDPNELVRHCLNEMRAVSVRAGGSGSGLDAKTAIVVDMDNVNLPRTKYLVASPAPPVGDPMHYDAFIQSICSQFTRMLH